MPFVINALPKEGFPLYFSRHEEHSMLYFYGIDFGVKTSNFTGVSSFHKLFVRRYLLMGILPNT